MASHITAKRVVLTSFFVDLLDIAINIVAALITGSVVMAAELFQAIADLISSAFLLTGLKRPNKEKVFWTFLSALMMLCFAAPMSFYFGLQRFLHPEKVHNIFLAYTALIIAAGSNGYAFYISAKRILARRRFGEIVGAFKSSKLIMTKNTFVLDLMGASSACVGLTALVLYHVTGNMKFDGLGAMGIGVTLAVLSLDLIINMRMLQKSIPTSSQ